MTQTEFKTLSYHVNDNGVAIITIDLKDRPVNVLTLEMYEDFHAVIEQLKSDDSARGAVICSGKDTFFAGGDLKRLVNMHARDRSPEEAYSESRHFTTALRKLELCGKPVAVAINGSALGGGLELALACNYRVCVDEPKVLLGLPEVSVGLLPGGGGTQRLPRMIGVEKAADLILNSKTLAPQEAVSAGLIDAIADRGSLLSTAEKLVLSCEDATRPWDARGFAVPGGAGLNGAKMNGLFQNWSSKIGSTYNHNYPAPIAALRALFKGTSCGSIDKGFEVESREFAKLTGRVETRNIIRTMFLNKGVLDKQLRRPSDIPVEKLAKVAIHGDTSAQSEEIERLQAFLAKGRIEVCELPNDEVELVIALSDAPLTDVSALAPNATIAVANERAISAFATATFGLDGRVVGMNFPGVTGVGCVEIARIGDKTSDASLAKAFDLARQVRKTATLQVFSGTWYSTQVTTALAQECQELVKEGAGRGLVKNGLKLLGIQHGEIDLPSDANDTQANLDFALVKARLMTRPATLTLAMIQTGAISAEDADAISVFGCGFPSWTGGLASYVDTIGIDAFSDRLDEWSSRFGPQFTLPETANESAISQVYERLYA